MGTDWKPDVLAVNYEAINKARSRKKVEVQTSTSLISSTNVIDFMAIWIYFALFVIFNCVYWKIY